MIQDHSRSFSAECSQSYIASFIYMADLLDSRLTIDPQKITTLCELFIYKLVPNPIWTYEVQLQGSANPSNTNLLRRSQFKILNTGRLRSNFNTMAKRLLFHKKFKKLKFFPNFLRNEKINSQAQLGYAMSRVSVMHLIIQKSLHLISL